MIWAMMVVAGSSPAFAADPPPATVSCPSATTLPPSPPPSRPGGAAESAVNVTADRVEYQGDTSLFTGNVEIQYENETLVADRVVYDQARDQLEASGNVHVRNTAGDVIDSSFLQVQRRDNTGYVEGVTFRFRGDRARGDARRIYFRSRQLVELEHTRYTHCPPGQDSWFIVARDIELDYERDLGTATNAYISFMSVPIFYWPYMSFPLSDARKTGFLPPYFGTDPNSGFFIAAPYYINLAPQYDATLTPRYMQRRGLQMLTEGRYLGENFDGLMNFDYIEDRAYGDDRYAARYTHHHYFSPLWSAEANYNRVSDKTYLTDFAIGIANATTTHVPQKIETRYGNQIWRGFARAFAYQTLDPTIKQEDAPYSRLPEIEVVADAPTPGGRTRYEFAGSYVNFDHETKVAGQRIALYPAVSAPLRNSYSYLIPKAGLRYNYYQLGNIVGEETPTLSVPVYSVDSGLIFERNLGGNTQTLEPRLFYVYIPYRDQDQLPNFDTGPQDFTYANLFRENRFFGGDRVGDTDHIALGMTSRVMDPLGAEWLRLSLGQVYYREPHRVFTAEEKATLPANYNQHNTSYVVGQARARLGRPWYMRNDLQWDPYASTTRKSSNYLQYMPNPEEIVNFGYLYSNLPGETEGARERQVEISTQWRLHERWSVLAQYVYSISSRSNRESYAGFEYNDCCWAGRVYVQRVIDPLTQAQVNKYFFEFELSGLVRLGAPKITPLSRGAFAFTD